MNLYMYMHNIINIYTRISTDMCVCVRVCVYIYLHIYHVCDMPHFHCKIPKQNLMGFEIILGNSKANSYDFALKLGFDITWGNSKAKSYGEIPQRNHMISLWNPI